MAARVAEFIQANKDAILHSWETLVTSAGHEVAWVGATLRDDVPAVLDELVTWLSSDAAPETSQFGARTLDHAIRRLDEGLPLSQLLREYRLLRETIIRLVLEAEDDGPQRPGARLEARRARIEGLARLNACLDVVLAQSMERFVAERDRRAAQERAQAERFRALASASSEVQYRMSLDWSQMRELRSQGFLANTDEPNANWLEEYIHPDDQPRVMAAIREAIRSKSVFQFEHRVRRADGSLGWTLSRAVPVTDDNGDIVEWFGSASDITERKQAEAARESLVQVLREEDRRKTEFLAVLSHELRNPLTPIRNSLYVLERAAPGGDQARRAQTVIGRQVEQLARLVQDVLEITRLTSSKVQLQRDRIQLDDLVQRTVEDHRSTLEKAGLTLEMSLADEPVFVNGDRNRLAQVLGNLLQNSAKFTPSGGHVIVSLSADDVERRAVLRVADNGVGITPDLLEGLFQPFTQAKQNLDRSMGGLGLGLALVKGLVELHGGEVRAHSAGVDHGSEFTVFLPLDVQEAKVVEADLARVESHRRRVLVIEDNIDAADSLCEALEFDGHAVAVAYTGLDGIAKAREFHPDVVLCDIGLPGMDGYDVARALRSDEALKDVRLVALSGYALPEDLQLAAEAGFDRHIAKPPSLERISAVLGDESGRMVRGGRHETLPGSLGPG